MEERRVYTQPCRHVRLVLPDSVRRNPQILLKCQFCTSNTSSQVFKQVVIKLENRVQDLGPLAFEVAMLPNGVEGKRKYVDICAVRWGIGVEVDGQQHFQGKCHGVIAKQQYEWDRKVDAAFEEARLRLVRLHCDDLGEWVTIMQAAMHSVRTNDTTRFVFKTRSYKTFEELYARGRL